MGELSLDGTGNLEASLLANAGGDTGRGSAWVETSVSWNRGSV